MKTLLLSLSLLFLTTGLQAQELNSFRWKSRLVLAFTPSPEDPNFEKQMRLLYEETEAFKERNVTFIMITPDGKYENTGRFLKEADARKYYEHFSVAQYQFELILVGLDGYEKFRAANRVTPPSVLLDLIDGMPMRQRERIQGYNNRSNVTKETPRVVNKRRKFD